MWQAHTPTLTGACRAPPAPPQHPRRAGQGDIWVHPAETPLASELTMLYTALLLHATEIRRVKPRSDQGNTKEMNLSSSDRLLFCSRGDAGSWNRLGWWQAGRLGATEPAAPHAVHPCARRLYPARASASGAGAARAWRVTCPPNCDLLEEGGGCSRGQRGHPYTLASCVWGGGGSPLHRALEGTAQLPEPSTRRPRALREPPPCAQAHAGFLGQVLAGGGGGGRRLQKQTYRDIIHAPSIRPFTARYLMVLVCPG